MIHHLLALKYSTTLHEATLTAMEGPPYFGRCYNTNKQVNCETHFPFPTRKQLSPWILIGTVLALLLCYIVFPGKRITFPRR